MLINNVKIVDAKKVLYGSVLIEDGLIKKIFKEDEDINLPKDTEIIEGKGFALLPSFVDMHCHLRDPGYLYKEDLKSGQKAALKGGYTTLCTMANTKPVCDNTSVLQYIFDKSRQLDLCHIIQISALTKNLEGKELVDFEEMLKYTKLFSDDGKTIFSEEVMKKALILSNKFKFRVLTHCQPEFEIVKRDLNLLKEVGGNLHICHISLKKTLDLIREFKDKGFKFTCEVTPHHIFGYGLDYRVNPSFREKEDVESLIEGIKQGYIDVIATDHAPHSLEDKRNGAPGISLIEVAFSMVYKVFYENGISLNKLSELMSYNPARILNLNCGLIEEGYEANLILVDLDEEYRIDTDDFISKGKNNPFNGEKVLGKVKMTFKKGSVKYDNR
ncbi:dihydroorotase [Caloranaerobacter azorensis DSM 13643]|uniref:Dihydroorotase n=1 Tax=Caloranaerobacter azorensis DSM 13643 TaxID=1121264 RepID=A0A1M5VZZ8_9FIRM|nr:dihydroorotase [Caloranaerobacter azorensis]SHH80836.1 dihydroorotase [Caloranaerobacter azorensis DSM 13643]